MSWNIIFSDSGKNCGLNIKRLGVRSLALLLDVSSGHRKQLLEEAWENDRSKSFPVAAPSRMKTSAFPALASF